MNDVPHNDDPSDDIDDLYRRAAAQDPSRPSPRVRKAVLQHAAQRAAERALERPSPPKKAQTFFPPRRAAILGALAAAVLAGLVIAPQFLLTPPQPTTFKQPVEIARIQAPVPPPPRAESVQPYVPATSSPPPPAAAPAPPQPPAGATTRVNALSADVVAGGYVPQDQTYIVTEAPDSPVIGAAVRRAAEQGDIAKLQFFLDRRADINARDADNRSPLMLAVTHRRTKVVELLLTHGADVNAADRTGTTPLQAAESTHQTDIAATLRAAGAH